MIWHKEVLVAPEPLNLTAQESTPMELGTSINKVASAAWAVVYEHVDAAKSLAGHVVVSRP